MKALHRITTAVMTIGLPILLMSGVTAAQTDSSQNTISNEHLAKADVDTLAGSGKESIESRTSRATPSLEDMQFRIPRPVSTEPFDYTSLRASNYDLEAFRITGQITLDGILSEEEWQFAQPAMNFYQVEPDEGAPASQPTEVRVLYDRANLYIGFMCYDSDPDAIQAPDMSRDTRLSYSNDMVQVVIAPMEGGREAFEFQTNPNGARTDTFVSKEGASFDNDWNGYWNVASTRHDLGWTAEFVIPFHVLRFTSKPVQNWSINFGRRIQRDREETYWVPLSRRDGRQALYRFGKGGRLVGLQNIKPGGRLQVLPFSVLGVEGARFNSITPAPSLPIAVTDFDTDIQRKIGGDLKWSVTSGITLNATVNPDFAQVEADDQVVNLSRFAFQFSEKRPFFLERSDIFSLSRSGGGYHRGGGSTPQIFFSRRVGRQLPDGSSVPVDLGMRLTGKVGSTTIGYFNAQTRETRYDDDGVIETEPLTNWQAIRVSQDVGARSSFGLLATFKEPNPGWNDDIGTVIPRFAGSNFNRVLGFDGNIAFRSSQHQLQMMFAKSWTDTLSNKSEEITWRVEQKWRNRWMDYSFSYLEIGDNFIAQSGFIRQTDIRRAGYSVSFNPFIRKYGIRNIQSSIRGNYLTNRGDSFSNPETWQFNPSVFFSLENGVGFNISWTRNFDTLSGTSNRRIAGVHFAPGQYTYDQGRLFFFTNRGKKISGESNMSFGKFYGGDLISLSGGLSIKPNPRLAIEPGLNWNRIERSDLTTPVVVGEYDYNNRLIPRIRTSYSFTPNLSFNSFVQINIDKKRQQDSFHLNTVTMNFLVAYRSPFGHSFFLAFNQFHNDSLDTDPTFGPYDRTPLRLRDQQLVAKFSYLLNL